MWGLRPAKGVILTFTIFFKRIPIEEENVNPAMALAENMRRQKGKGLSSLLEAKKQGTVRTSA